MKKLKGIVPVLITPLNSDKSVDTEALKALCTHYEAQNVSGIWILGTGAEDMCLSFHQRMQVTEVVTETLSDNVAKLVGCSFFSVAESFAFIDATEGMKIDAYHAMPYHPKVSLRQLHSWYGKLADRCSKPLWAYTSGNWAQRMGPDFVAGLKEIPNIGGVKYSSSNTVDVQGAIELMDDDFQVITAVVKTLYACLSLGVPAATTVEATIFLPEASEIYELYEKGQYAEAMAAQQKLNNVFLKYPSPAAKDNFLRVAELKYMLSLQGLAQEYVTDYYRELEDDEKATLKAWYDANLKERRVSH